MVAALLPTPTTAPTLASASYGAILAPRVTTTGLYDYDSSCYNLDGLISCANMLSGCYGNILAATNYVDAANSCLCASGMPYLNCYANVLSTAGCYEDILGTVDWNSYMLDYFYSTCGTIPPSAMAQMSPPATVSLSFETVDIVTATGQPAPSEIVQPNYSGGELLKGECTKTDFTLVDAGSTVYFAGFNGCNGERPECCPWPVATTSAATTAGGTNQDTGNHIGFDFPQPQDSNQATLASCADDYYSISGGCCPVGYWLFTTEVGGQTPCYSSMNRVATPPTLTAGLEGNPTDTSKPTSAVVNIVWSMRYPVVDQSGGLSTAAKAGIGAGGGVAAILIGVLAICLWRSRRKNKKLEAEKKLNGGAAASIPPQGPQQPPMMQQAAIPNGQYTQYPQGMAPFPDPSRHGSIMTNGSASSPAPLVPQSTGTSYGGVSELSSQSGHGLLQSGVQFAGSPMPRSVSHASSNGTGSPSVPPSGNGYPAPIAEADEGHGQRQTQPLAAQGAQQGYSATPYELPQQPPQTQELPQPQMGQHPQFFPVPGQPPQPFYGAPGQQPQFYPQQQPPQVFYNPNQQPQPFYNQQQYQTPPHLQQQPYYNPNQQNMYQTPPHLVPEMSANREVDPPQEVAGSHVRQ
ncbi:hypothetical protein B0T16DRAFT_450855 [Cercophora newfieldiana]|uniref:Uncharacterized protein n=1 Tax=Cercophora newfieldiana TaxID=92897 RepID=A0AA40CXK7_9PEZI|nr:hypothetical protein B0T16DRAFT_450855 [Cercophora newfieldiana]